MGFGISHVQNAFKRAKAIIPTTLASTTANSISFISSTDYGANFDITLYGISDGVYMNSLSTAPTSTNSFLLNTDVTIDLKVEDRLALTSSSTTASYQAIIWEG